MIDLGQLVTDAAATLADAPVGGIALVEREVDEVLGLLDEQLRTLREADFEAKAHIARLSFGGGEEAVDLAGHHDRAHRVVVAHLGELVDELTDFRAAIEEAKRLTLQADEDAEARIRVLIDRTDAMATDAIGGEVNP